MMRLFGLFWEAKLPAYLKTIHDLVNSVIEDRMRIRQENSEPLGDFLSLFLDDEGLDDNEKSMEALKDVILNFIIAGRDTTAQTLSWMTYELMQNPDVLQKVRDEVEGIERLDYATLSKGLPYLRAVMNETLRLHPVVPCALKFASKDTTIPGEHPVHLSKGDGIIVHTYSMGRNPSIWPEPFKFNPERHIGVKHSEYKLFVFNAGPRACLGRDFAYLEALMCAIRMVENFDFTIVDPNSIAFMFSFTLPMRNGPAGFHDFEKGPVAREIIGTGG